MCGKNQGSKNKALRHFFLPFLTIGSNQLRFNFASCADLAHWIDLCEWKGD